MAAQSLVFYTTLGCTLCEKAKVELWPLLTKYQLQFAPVDIADDERLSELFGWSIPVVGLGDTGDVLCWPFTGAELDVWLADRLSD